MYKLNEVTTLKVQLFATGTAPWPPSDSYELSYYSFNIILPNTVFILILFYDSALSAPGPCTWVSSYSISFLPQLLYCIYLHQHCNNVEDPTLLEYNDDGILRRSHALSRHLSVIIHNTSIHSHLLVLSSSYNFLLATWPPLSQPWIALVSDCFLTLFLSIPIKRRYSTDRRNPAPDTRFDRRTPQQIGTGTSVAKCGTHRTTATISISSAFQAASSISYPVSQTRVSPVIVSEPGFPPQRSLRYAL